MPDAPLNVFDHQCFRLRDTRTGARAWRSFREIVTGPDESLAFDYGHEYLDVAALGLCAALAQAAFEPKSVRDLAARLDEREGMSEEDFDRGVRDLAGRFTIDGAPGTRFLQGPEPDAAKQRKATREGDLARLVLTVQQFKGETNKTRKDFLNRPDPAWVVRPDQVPLLLFARQTFYEKGGGAGYKSGTSSDVELRTYLLDRPEEDGMPSLRRSVWLNVLTRQAQDDEHGFYRNEVDGWMWDPADLARYPPEVSQGGLSLRAGLFWSTAHAWIVFETLTEPRPCVVTGDVLPTGARAGVAAVLQPTRVGYGHKEKGKGGQEVRRSFFLHPAAPWRFGQDDGRDFWRHLRADETTGLVGEAAGLLFAVGDSGTYGTHAAPLVKQLSRFPEGQEPHVDLLTFGFQMTGSKANVHGGQAVERFTYPALPARGSDRDRALLLAHGVVENLILDARNTEGVLAQAIRLCTLAKIKAGQETRPDGRRVIKLEMKENEWKMQKTLARDAARAFWGRIGGALHALLGALDGASADDLEAANDALRHFAQAATAHHAWALFRGIYDQFNLSPQHLVAAHQARRLLYGWLYKRLNERLADAIKQEPQVPTVAAHSQPT